ncbi:MAG: LptF/LptG family permease [Xenococcaceae cyanobacterium MO_207.B15]|nr:LptF/LptG family permease [Xenococcaceae cyanobacterium MO_207.B15]
MKIKVKLLDQYIWQQLIVFFIGSVGLLASLAVALGTISDLTYKINEYNLPYLVAIQIFCLKIPEYTAYALPIALLLTTLLVYGSFNNNLELIAFYSSGINVYSIVTPAIIFSLFITGATFLVNELIVPNANYQVVQLENPFLPETKFTLQNKDIFYPEYQVIGDNNYQLVRLYYAKKFDGNHFQNIIILNWNISQLQKIIIAERASWNQDQNTWEFTKGRIENFEPLKVDFFEKKTLFLPPVFFEITNQTREPQEMSLSQARKYLKLIINSNDEQKIRLLKVRIQQKLAFPWICIVFAIIGSGVGVNFHQVNRGRGFAICVGIVFTYYVLGFVMGSLGILGLVSPVVAGWLPNFLGWGMGGWLLYRNNH